jgi:hypothetical protein
VRGSGAAQQSTDHRQAEVRRAKLVAFDVRRFEITDDTVSFRAQSEMLDRCPDGAHQFTRAREVQGLLAERGRHRGVPPADVLIAAAAEAGNVPVRHYDHDYDLIGEVPGQAVRWILPAGSLP